MQERLTARDYIRLAEIARYRIAKYFDVEFEYENHPIIGDYFRKIAEMGATFAYTSSISTSETLPKFEKFEYPFYNHIFEKSDGRPVGYMAIVLSAILNLTIVFLKIFILSLITKTVTVPKPCLYLRKDAEYDQNLGQLVISQIQLPSNIVMLNVKRHQNQYGFVSLNQVKGASIRAVKAFVLGCRLLPLFIRIFHKNKIPHSLIKRFIVDTYIAFLIKFLNPTLIIGVLVDKPIFNLIYHYKPANTTMISINESFLYPPFRNFDYVNTDIYIGTHPIERSEINTHGGKIKKFEYVDFFRNELVSISFGLSDDLTKKVECFEQVVLACSNQISKGFGYFTEVELFDFIGAIFNAATLRPNTLFILKEKKGELSHLSDALKAQLKNQKNIEIERSIVPKAKKLNQFEDLLTITNLMVSMNSGSTTISQSLQLNIPAIAVNDAHPKSLLADFDQVEVASSELPKTISHWLDLSPKDTKEKVQSIKNKLNLSGRNGLEMISDIINNVSASNIK